MATLEGEIHLEGTDIVIRSVLPDDADALVSYLMRITSQSDNLTFESDESALFADERLFIETLEASENALALIALQGEQIVGSITFMGGKRPKCAHAGEFGISVDRQWWGKGIAHALMKAMIGWARGASIAKIDLEVRTDNHRAIALYHDFGFVEEGVIREALVIEGRTVDLMHMGLRIGDDLSARPFTVSSVPRSSPVRPVTIREAQPSDAEAILSLVDRIARETPFLEIGSEGIGLSVVEEQAILSRFASSDRMLYLVAFLASGEPIGLLTCTAGERKRLRHSCQFSLMVDAPWRGNGIGSALIQRMLLWAQRSNIRRIGLHVHAQNHTAIALYRRFGFVTEAVISRAFLQHGSYQEALAMALLFDHKKPV
ncbi:MAG: GNAT family N-acetyltransferase [Sphaerochaetaceae bacterium]|jgi:RimJ/RimL family protein N-acetyltransferase|nr:GNAT family N-acetyltransferase [Sphaerochaetaceae bacterium]